MSSGWRFVDAKMVSFCGATVTGAVLREQGIARDLRWSLRNGASAFTEVG
jgi:hypothetical protein